MGKIIKMLSVAKLQDNPVKEVEFELNEPAIVHIQNEAWRLEMTKNEFRDWGNAVVQAAKKLRKNKGD